MGVREMTPLFNFHLEAHGDRLRKVAQADRLHSEVCIQFVGMALVWICRRGKVALASTRCGGWWDMRRGLCVVYQSQVCDWIASSQQAAYRN